MAGRSFILWPFTTLCSWAYVSTIVFKNHRHLYKGLSLDSRQRRRFIIRADSTLLRERPKLLGFCAVYRREEAHDGRLNLR